MPVSHDLCQDLGCAEDKIQQKRSKDPMLDKLIRDYVRIDAEVANAEKPPVTLPDTALEELKLKRLKIKDLIAAFMQK